MKIHRWLLLATVVAAGCGGYSAPDEVVSGSGVYTQPAPGADFKPLRTFYLDPKMEVWQDGTQGISQAVPSATVSIINQRLGAYGYSPTALTTPPQVGVRLAWIQNSYTYYYSYCSGYWYGWYGCWPTWGYAGSYSTGTVLMLMVDLRPAPPPAPPPTDGGGRPVLWATGLYAVLDNLDNTASFNTALGRAFDQSTYLKTSAVP